MTERPPHASAVPGGEGLQQWLEQEIAQQEAYALRGPSEAWPQMTPEHHRGVAAILRLMLLRVRLEQVASLPLGAQEEQQEPKRPNPCAKCGTYLWGDSRPCWCCSYRKTYGASSLGGTTPPQEAERLLIDYDEACRQDSDPRTASRDPRQVEAALRDALIEDDYVDESIALLSAAPRLLRSLLADRDALTAQLDALKAENAERVRRLQLMADGLQDYVVYHGGIHDGDCPGDDTCDCTGKLMNDAADDACRLAADALKVKQSAPLAMKSTLLKEAAASLPLGAQCQHGARGYCPHCDGWPHDSPNNTNRAKVAGLRREPQEWQTRESAPEDCTPFLAYGPTLIDLDFNPNGVVEACFDGERFIGAVWNGTHDIWNTVPIEFTHWQRQPSYSGAGGSAPPQEAEDDLDKRVKVPTRQVQVYRPVATPVRATPRQMCCCGSDDCMICGAPSAAVIRAINAESAFNNERQRREQAEADRDALTAQLEASLGLSPLPLEGRFDELRALEANWDGYKAPPLDRAAIDRAEAFLRAVSIVPCGDGGVQLEWHGKDYDVEVEFEPDGSTLVWSSNSEEASTSRGREQALREALKVIHKTVRGDEKSECWTIRKWLDERGVFNDDISGQRRLVEAVCVFATLSLPEGTKE